MKAGEFGPDRPIIREWTTDPKKFAKATDVLICVVGATCGKINLGADCAIGRSVAAIRPQPAALDQFFLHYFLEGQVLALRGGSLGAAQTVISKDMLADLPIPLPPLDEQKRIVAVLDEAFEGLSRARANAESNLADARELFESYLGETAESHANRFGTVAVAEIATEITDGDHMPPPKADEGVPFITISNVNKETHEIDFSDTFKVPPAYYDALKEKRQPRAGDVLYTVTGSFGIPILLTGDQTFCFQRHIALVRPEPSVNSEWLFYMLKSRFAFSQANEGATGTAQRTVSLKTLRGLRVPNTPQSLQADLAAGFRARWEASRMMADGYGNKVESLDTLRQSLLQKAFSGELT